MFWLKFYYVLHLKPYLSAAKSSCKFAIGSPFAAMYDAIILRILFFDILIKTATTDAVIIRTPT